MIRTYTLAIEGAAGSYSAYVPELPTILVTGVSPEEVTSRAKEAIALYWEELRADRLNCLPDAPRLPYES